MSPSPYCSPGSTAAAERLQPVGTDAAAWDAYIAAAPCGGDAIERMEIALGRGVDFDALRDLQRIRHDRPLSGQNA